MAILGTVVMDPHLFADSHGLRGIASDRSNEPSPGVGVVHCNSWILLERPIGVPVQCSQLNECSISVFDRFSPGAEHGASRLNEFWDHVDTNNILVVHTRAISDTFHFVIEVLGSVRLRELPSEIKRSFHTLLFNEVLDFWRKDARRRFL